ncbi:MAG: flagellin [Gemmatimonas sp.]
MRITNNLIQRSSINRLQSSLQQVDKAREDVSTGRRIRAMSDDPSSGSEVVRTSSELRAVEQYRRNLKMGQSRQMAEEGVLDQVTNALTRGIELALGQASATASPETRSITKAEIDELIEYTVSLGNTKFADDYLFGGTRGNEQPLRVPTNTTDPFTNLVDTSNNPVNPSGHIELEINDGHFVSPNHNATEIFIDSGTLQSLRDLSTALGNNDVAGINTAMAGLQNANNNIQTLIGQQGARGSEFLVTTDQLSAQEVSLNAYRSDLRDLDIEKAMIELAGRTTGYQAAMTATAKVLGLSLANYL